MPNVTVNPIQTISVRVNPGNQTVVQSTSQFVGASNTSGSGGGISASGYLNNSVIFANTTGYLSNTNTIKFFSSNNSLYVANAVITGYGIVFPDGSIQTAAASGTLAQSAFDEANSANVLAQAAFTSANTASSNTIQLQGGLNTANANISLLQGGLNTANANIAYILGVDLAQNTSISLLQGGLNTANANIAYILGVDLAQNTLISAANTLAQGAFDKANSSNVLAQNAYNQANLDITSISTTPGVYGNSTYVPVTTIAANGRVTSIVNTAISGVTIGTTTINPAGTTLTLGGLTSITVTQDATSALQLATKQYVDAAISNTNYHLAAQISTTGPLTATYNNGSSGIGANLTNSGTQTALVIDSYTTLPNDRVLVKNQTLANQNGVYVVTSNGSISTNWILTRASDYDQSILNEVSAGDYVFVSGGAINGNTSWIQTSTGTIVIGTSPITFVQIAGPGTYSAAAPITLTGTQFSLATTGTAGTYGNSAYIPVLTTDTYGRVSSVSNTAISIPISQVIGLQGLEDSQNTNISLLQDGLNTANANISYIFGVNLAQNTLITAANTLAQGAFDKANSANVLAQNSYNYANTLLPNTGSLITVNPVSSLYLPNTGSNSNPTLSIGYANTGLYSPALGDIAITANGYTQFYVAGTNPASNYLQITGASSGNSPSIIAQGSDANVSILMRSKGNGIINLQVQSTTASANSTLFQIREDTTIGAGTSSLTLVGASVASGRVALRSSKALFLGSSAGNDIGFYTGATTTSDGSKQFNINSVTSAVNYLQVSGATSGNNSPILSAIGSNTDINIILSPKGSGSIQVSGPPGVPAGLVLSRDTTTVTNSARLFFDSSTAPFAIYSSGGAGGLLINSTASPANAITGSGGTSGVTQFRIASLASSVNFLQVIGAILGNNPILSAQGANTDINITMTPKGNGAVNLTSGLLFTGANTITGANNGITFVDGTLQITAAASNAYSQAAFTTANNASSNTIQLQGGLNTANANIAYILGVDNAQNTLILAANTLAQGAFDKSNSANILAQGAFDKANGSSSGYLANSIIFANTTGYLSNTSTIKFFASNNSLYVANAVITGYGIVFSDGTTQTSAASYAPRVTSIASANPIIPVSTSTDQYNITALAVAASVSIPTGTPVDAQKLMIRIKDNGTARALSWNISGANSYRVVGTTLPTTTVASKVTYVGCIYNSQDSFWDVIAVTQQ
jgi:hypothetical protein